MGRGKLLQNLLDCTGVQLHDLFRPDPRFNKFAAQERGLIEGGLFLVCQVFMEDLLVFFN